MVENTAAIRRKIGLFSPIAWRKRQRNLGVSQPQLGGVRVRLMLYMSPFQYHIRRLIMRCHKVLKARDVCSEFSSHFEIGEWLSSLLAKLPAKFQSDLNILIPNLMGLGLCEISWQEILLDIEITTRLLSKVWFLKSYLDQQGSFCECPQPMRDDVTL